MTQPVSPEAPEPLALPAAAAPTTGAPFDWARSRDVVLTLIGAGVLLYMLLLALQSVTKIVLLLAVSGLVALVLDPVVRRLQRRGLSRGVAAAATYLLFVFGVFMGLLWAGGSLVQQLTQLNAQLPAYAQSLQEQLPPTQAWLSEQGVRVELEQLQRDFAAALQSTGGEILGRTLGVVTGVTDILTGTFLVLVISLYLVVDGSRIRNNLASVVPPSKQWLFVLLESSVLHVVGGYVRGQVTIAAILGVLVGTGCWLLGVQFPLVLGLLAFCFEFIPMVGPLLSAIPALVISLFQPFPLVVLVLGFFLLVMLLEGQVLSPRITARAVGLHPIANILALIGGAELAGIWGALFAVPLVGLGVVLGTAAIRELRARETTRASGG